MFVGFWMPEVLKGSDPACTELLREPLAQELSAGTGLQPGCHTCCSRTPPNQRLCGRSPLRPITALTVPICLRCQGRRACATCGKAASSRQIRSRRAGRLQERSSYMKRRKCQAALKTPGLLAVALFLLARPCPARRCQLGLGAYWDRSLFPSMHIKLPQALSDVQKCCFHVYIYLYRGHVCYTQGTRKIVAVRAKRSGEAPSTCGLKCEHRLNPMQALQ